MTNYMLKGKVLGEGAFGTVRIGTQLTTGKIVAVKTYYKLKIIHEDTIKAISREAELMAKVDSPHVVKFVEKIENVRNIHLVMEYAGRWNLKTYLETQSSLKKPNDTARLLQGIAKGLSAMHGQRVIHRDLKLENIVLNSPDSPKLVDFGFAREMPTGLVQANPFGVCGTIFYMSPELLRERNIGSKKDKVAFLEQYLATGLDAKDGDLRDKNIANICESLETDNTPVGPPYDLVKADIWALGIIFYYVFARKLPFGGANEAEVRRAIQESDPDYKDFDADEISLVSLLLKREPQLRPTTSEILAHKYFDSCRV